MSHFDETDHQNVRNALGQIMGTKLFECLTEHLHSYDGD